MPHGWFQERSAPGGGPSVVTPGSSQTPRDGGVLALTSLSQTPNDEEERWEGGLKEFLNFIAASLQKDRSAVGTAEDRVVNSAQMLA